MRRVLRLFALVLAVLNRAEAQHVVPLPGGGARSGPVFPCRLPVHEAVAPTADPSVRALAREGGAPVATFEVTYNGFPPEAEAAFQAAVDAWAEHIASPVPIRVEANWTALGANVLGSAGPYLLRDFAAAPLAGTWYPSALADALAGRDLDTRDPDIEANFNSAFPSWHFGLDGSPPGNRYDLTTVVLHELGHGLGFIGSFTVEDGAGRLGLDEAPGIPFAYDRFTVDADGRSLLDYAIPSVALAQALQDPEVPAGGWTDAVFFNGPTTRATNGARPAALYAPEDWNEGSSYSHFDEATFPLGTPYALMTPFIGRGERVTSPDALACAALADLGWSDVRDWPTGAACAALITEPPEPSPMDEEYTLSSDGESFVLRVATGQQVRALLFDVLGRRLDVAFDERVDGGTDGKEFELPQGLASATYFLRIVGETFAATRAVTRVR